MTRPNTFLWPVGSTLNFYKRRNRLIGSYKTRRLDLADTLMLYWPKPSRTIYLGISRKASAGSDWTDGELTAIENRIRFDLNFDGYGVSVQRLGPLTAPTLGTEFLWKLCIRTKWI